MSNEIIVTNASVQEEKVNSTPVSSVNGKAGVVHLTQDDIPDGETYVQFSKTDREKLKDVDKTIETITREVLQEAKLSGEFDGEDGYTPQKGVDYYTEDDKADIVEDVVNSVIGDIDEALDRILEIQNELICGTLEYELGTSDNGDPYYIVKGIGTYKSSHLVIPDTYEGVVVSEIAENAFRGNTKLTSAVIGNNILTVGKCAFEGCSNLTSIQLTKERVIWNDDTGYHEECYAQSDLGLYSWLASDSDPATVAQLWTTTQDEAGNGYILTTDTWHWSHIIK